MIANDRLFLVLRLTDIAEPKNAFIEVCTQHDHIALIEGLAYVVRIDPGLLQVGLLQKMTPDQRFLILPYEEATLFAETLQERILAIDRRRRRAGIAAKEKVAEKKRKR
jgi:hypothetical protein